MTGSRQAPADRRSALVVSAVLPFPGESGQQQRVRNKLLALQDDWHVTFLTFSPRGKQKETETRLLEVCDEALVLRSAWATTGPRRAWQQAKALAYTSTTALKRSNYAIGKIELSPARVKSATRGRTFDVAIFEYWHSHAATASLRERGLPCVLDMHDLLWQSYARELEDQTLIPRWLAARRVAAYRRREEAAWTDFDALISINRREDESARQHSDKVFYAPMGTDLDTWCYGPQESDVPRVAFYGGLGSQRNRRNATWCVEHVLPRIWRSRPETEFWIVGANPTASIVALGERDRRVKVTGFVDEAPAVLRTMALTLCPWWGKFGFRSRIVETLALGIPAIVSPDAIDGMDLRNGHGLFLAESASEMADHALRLLEDRDLAADVAARGRQAVESAYSFDATYGRWQRELSEWLDERNGERVTG